jgi:hypothetical protein
MVFFCAMVRSFPPTFTAQASSAAGRCMLVAN